MPQEAPRLAAPLFGLVALASACYEPGTGPSHKTTGSESAHAAPSASAGASGAVGSASAHPAASVAPAASSSGAPPAPEPAALGDTDEGMWLLNAFPSERLQKLHGFAPSEAWLQHVRASSVRLAGGCSGSMVSSRGLVMTNHHCAEGCIQELSTKEKNYMDAGFFAKTDADELKCPDIEINVLAEIKDVTDTVRAGLAGVSEQEFSKKRKAIYADIEKGCSTGDDVRCDVVDLYHGGQYHLYKYRRYQDVRLAFAPEQQIAFFGGDPDNFMFPRYDLDVSFLRVYENGAPLKPADFYRWSPAGAAAGELTFVAGHPGRTERSLTVAQLEYRRDVRMPERLLWWSELRGILTQFGLQGAEQKRVARGPLFEYENAIKAYKGRLGALVDREFFARKVEEERALRARVAADPALATSVGGAWDAMAAAQVTARRLHRRFDLVENMEGLDSTLFGMARSLVRLGAELGKPNAERLREYGDANLPALKQSVLTTAPITTDLDALTFGASLVHLREVLGPDDPFVKKLLGKDEPRELARRLIKNTKLGDLAVRKKLWDGGKAAIDAADDPLIEFARRVDEDARAIRKRWEDEVEGVEAKNSELIAKARFAAFGTSQYPDATFTLRLSYGVVKGWNEEGTEVTPFTTFAGAFERHTGQDPFALPKSWLEAKGKVDPTTPFNLVTTNDIIGGNSGSPMFNQNAEVVGLIFDGNIHSLGGAFGFDPVKNRAVAVDSRALKEALGKVYGATRIVDELGK